MIQKIENSKKNSSLESQGKTIGIFVIISIGLFLMLNFVSAVSNLDIPLPTALGDSYGTFKAGTNVSLVQTCTNLTDFCDECNLTSLKYPSGEIIGGINIKMTKSFSLFNFTLDSQYTKTTGHYFVTGFCTAGGVYSPWSYGFEVTPSGHKAADYAAFSIFIILFLFGIVILGFALKTQWIIILGGMAMIFLGVYLVQNGIIIYRDNLTLYFSYLITFLGVGFSLWAGIDWIQEYM